MNLYERLAQRASMQPDAVAVIDSSTNQTRTYRQLLSEINLVAEALEPLSIRRAERVAVHIPSGYNYIVWTYALWKLGACSVPLAFELADPEKETVLATIGPSRVVSPTTVSLPVGDVELRLEHAGQSFEVRSNRTVSSPPPAFESLEPAFLRFTSGTTGLSKGVVLSHETIWARIEAANTVIGLTPRDRVLWLLSMSYHFAVSIVAYLCFGTSIVLAESAFGESIVRAGSDWGATIIYGSPLHYQLAAQDRSESRLSGVRLALSTTAALSGEVFDRFMARFGLPLRQAFGIIEVGLPCIQIDDPPDPVSVGRPLPAYRLRFQDVGLDQGGLIEIQGPGILDAYYSPWCPREEVLRHGWFSTGDLGFLNSRGELVICGRQNDVLSVAGMKFFPQEVESVLRQHPNILDARVFGQPHPVYGELPEAEVVVEIGTEVPSKEAKRFCAARLAEYKVPRRIHVVESLPRTASGKIIRRHLEEPS